MGYIPKSVRDKLTEHKGRKLLDKGKFLNNICIQKNILEW